MVTICVFGDSSAWGAWDFEKGGWVNRLWLALCNSDYKNEVYNLSISGGTTETILARFENEARIREADVLIFQTGGNDAAYKGGGGNQLVPLEKFRENIGQIIQRARKLTNKIIFVGLKDIDESKTMPVSWADVYYTEENLRNYNGVLKEICLQNDVHYLEMFGVLGVDDLADGIHPNASGHKKIFERIQTFLRDNQLIDLT